MLSGNPIHALLTFLEGYLLQTAQPPNREDGRWLCRPRSFCAKHDPSRRPPKYWHVVYDSGKPTPFVPVREAFQLEG